MNKLKIVETEDYILAVSDEEIKEDCLIECNGKIAKVDEILNEDSYPFLDKTTGWRYSLSESFKIIAHQPKGNAPELGELPLLPEIVTEDEIDFAEMFYSLLKQTYPTFDEWVEAKEYLKHKSATKIYSKEDLRKAIDIVRKDTYKRESVDKIIQSLNQSKTPKWFVAEYKTEYTEDGLDYKSDELKTTTINGKTYLIGKFTNE